jgi:hypothetical protein
MKAGEPNERHRDHDRSEHIKNLAASAQSSLNVFDRINAQFSTIARIGS